MALCGAHTVRKRLIVCFSEPTDESSGHMIGWLEGHAANAEGYNAPRMGMDDTVLAGKPFQDTLMNEPFGIGRLVPASGSDRRGIFDVEFPEILGGADQGRRLVAGHEERGIVQWIANADVTVSGQYLVIVKDVVCSNEKRKRLSKIGYHIDM